MFEAFSLKLRNETDLDALSNELVGVASETMKPLRHFVAEACPATEGDLRSRATSKLNSRLGSKCLTAFAPYRCSYSSDVRC